ncbi:MAG TPA: nucleoside phosphorylase [Anaerolineae bacterium]|nr:nucleoside phosphorylase [Anaerolineae bacterium]HQH38725.1 nucleoside phosphorylase [Anaerolineae bacterium]
MRQDYPILEFDPTREAIIEPGKLIAPIDIPEHCVICFFQDVLSGLVNSGRATHVVDGRSEMGRHPLYEMEVDGQRLAFFHPGVGAPLAAGLLEEVIARGCRTFIVCGGAGVLNSAIAVGHIVVPVAAVRDEGISYHYLPPAREVPPSPEAVEAIERVLERHRLPYAVGKTWTTDAFYRETPDKVRLRREEGCLTVEMEAAAFFAVARFRHVCLAQMLYGGDDLGGAAWDHRDWVSRGSVRAKLFWLAAEACLEL